MITDRARHFKTVFEDEGAAGIAKLLQDQPEFRAVINEPIFSFDSPPLFSAASRGDRKMIDVLLDAGADINARTKWWAGSFGVLDVDDCDLAQYLISRGAKLDAHAAAHHGMLEELRALIAANPTCVRAGFGDGQTPLHVARTVEIAELLLAHGANIDQLDVDHESTPAQYAVGPRPDVARYLVRRGCRTEILMAAALGDVDLARKHLDQIEMRVNRQWFPMKNPHAGGIIYTFIRPLGSDHTAHQIAWKQGHQELLDLLWQHSSETLKRRAIADRAVFAAMDDDTAAVVRALESGSPVEGTENVSPLHWACFHGNLEMVQAILKCQPPLEKTDTEFHARPLGWAVHGSLNGWHKARGNYTGVVEALIHAGAVIPPDSGGGSEAVREVLRRHR